MLTLPSQKVKGPWVISATYVGTILNSLVFGTLVDKWGRRPMFHITNITFIVCRCKAFFPLSNSIHTFLYLKPFPPQIDILPRELPLLGFPGPDSPGHLLLPCGSAGRVREGGGTWPGTPSLRSFATTGPGSTPSSPAGYGE